MTRLAAALVMPAACESAPESPTYTEHGPDNRRDPRAQRGRDHLGAALGGHPKVERARVGVVEEGFVRSVAGSIYHPLLDPLHPPPSTALIFDDRPAMTDADRQLIGEWILGGMP